MSVGPDLTRRHEIAQRLVQEAARNALSIELTPSAGSEECLEQLKDGRLDVAIVSACIVVPNDQDVMVLAALQSEAVHVLVRSEMAGAGPLSEVVRGKRVNLGVRGSTEWRLAQEFLTFAHLRLPTQSTPGDVIPTELGKVEVVKKCQEINQAQGEDKRRLIAELPDCLMVLGPFPSQVARQLIEAADYQIVPLLASRAFLMDTLQESHAETGLVRREFLERTLILKNSYFTTRGNPTEDCETVGSPLLIVARRQTPSHAVQQLMKTVFGTSLARQLQAKSPRDIATPYEIHPAAVAYLDRDKPLLIVNEIVDWFSKGFSIFGAFSAGALSLYSVLRRKKSRTPAQYFDEIRRLASTLELSHSDSPLPSSDLVRHVDACLSKLRHELIEDICERRIKGDQVIANILTLLRDTQHSLGKRDATAPRDYSPHDLQTLRQVA